MPRFVAKSVVLFSVFAQILAQDVGHFDNTNVERILDVSSQLVRCTVKITAENKGPEPTNQYFFAFPGNEIKSVSHISASSEAIPVGIVLDKKISSRELVFFKVSLPTALAVGKSIKLDVSYVQTHRLEPFPSKLQQGERQLVIYRDNHYFYSPYMTLKQTTKVKLASNRVESYTNTLKPNAQSDSSVTYGPYMKKAAYASEPFRIHYENQNSFLVVKNLQRWIEVSHWGTIQIEEKIDVKHEGAELKGSFSRYDFQRDMGSSPAVKSFKTQLPAGARDVYYRDEIGNISTSHMRTRFDSVEVDLRPRFPLYGGWKTHYVLGYSISTNDFLLHDGADGFVLKINFIDHIYDEVVIDKAVVKIILPEGSRDVRLKLPFSAQRHPDERHFTYLDVSGRLVIVLSKENLVEDHIQQFEVHYRFNKMRMLQEPLLVAIALMVLFFSVIVYVRMDFSIKSDPGKELQWKLSSLHGRIGRIQDKRETNYLAIDRSLDKYKLSKDQPTFETAMKKYLALQKIASEEMALLDEEARADSLSAATETIQELNRIDKSLKDHINSQVSLFEKLLDNKINKQQYSDQEMLYTKKKQEAYEKIKEICSNYYRL